MDTQTQDQTITIEIPTEQTNPDSMQGSINQTISPSNPQEAPQIQTEAKKEEISTENIIPKDPSIPTCSCPIGKPCEHYPTREPFIELIKPKHAGGRPCNLCQHLEKFQNKLRDYITECRGRESKKPRIPYLQEFADMIDVDKETIIDWSNKINEETKELEHQEFHRLIKATENLQELRLNQRLMGRYNPTGAIFLLKTKHKYIETEKQILAGSNDPNEKLQIEFINEKPLPEGVEK